MTTAQEIFVFGLANSLHCAGMCGPLCVGLLSRGPAFAAYHAARVGSYAVAGAVAGAVGEWFGGGEVIVSTGWISILFAAMLLLGAFLPWRLPSSALVDGALARGMRWLMGHGPVARGLGLGALTPLLPCGVLYVALAAALATGSSVHGAVELAVFALGAVPALALMQWQAGWLQRRLSAPRRALLMRGLTAVAAGVLLVRGVLALQGESCCH